VHREAADDWVLVWGTGRVRAKLLGSSRWVVCGAFASAVAPASSGAGVVEQTELRLRCISLALRSATGDRCAIRSSSLSRDCSSRTPLLEEVDEVVTCKRPSFELCCTVIELL